MYNRLQTARDGASLRLRIRQGDLARSMAPEPDGSIEQREPDDLYAPLGDFETAHDAGPATAPPDAACGT